MSVTLDVIRDGLALVQVELRRVEAEREALQRINLAYQELLILGVPAPVPALRLPPAVEEALKVRELPLGLAEPETSPEPEKPPHSPRGQGTVYWDTNHKRWSGRAMRNGKFTKWVTGKTEAEARAKLDALIATLSGAEPDSACTTASVPNAGTNAESWPAAVDAGTSSAPERVRGLSYDRKNRLWRGQVWRKGTCHRVHSRDRAVCLAKLVALRLELGEPSPGRPAKPPKPERPPRVCQTCQKPIDRPAPNARYCMAHSIAATRARHGRPAADSDHTPQQALIGAREAAIAHPVGPEGAYTAWAVEASGTAYPVFRDWFSRQDKPSLAGWREHLRVEAMFARLDCVA